ncbi:unnamed protein product [[Candida] boidinii]|nr:unnamed protein product [[Candida] boidinii]
MLQEPKIKHLIWWSRLNEGDEATFALLPGAEFAEALTGYFKHGNVASFVRQLHMYGFHKVCDNTPPPIPNGNAENSEKENIKTESSKNDKTSNENNSKDQQSVWEFRHSGGIFRKGHEDSLAYIKRRSSSATKNMTTASIIPHPGAQMGHDSMQRYVVMPPGYPQQQYPSSYFHQILK